jgi:hypothetical protein
MTALLGGAEGATRYVTNTCDCEQHANQPLSRDRQSPLPGSMVEGNATPHSLHVLLLQSRTPRLLLTQNLRRRELYGAD